MGGQRRDKCEEGVEISRETTWKKKNERAKKAKGRNGVCVTSCHTVCKHIFTQGFIPTHVFSSQEKDKTNSKHKIPHGEGMTAGMTSRSKWTVEQRSKEEYRNGMGWREWKIPCWWLFTGYSCSLQKLEASTRFSFSPLYLSLFFLLW